MALMTSQKANPFGGESNAVPLKEDPVQGKKTMTADPILPSLPCLRTLILETQNGGGFPAGPPRRLPQVGLGTLVISRLCGSPVVNDSPSERLDRVRRTS